MCDNSAVPYLDGEVVWVKIGNCWWPGEVCNESRLPEGLLSSIKKQPIAVVKFFQENTYEYVKSLANICQYNCAKKTEWIKRGLELYRAKNRYMDKFPADVITAEEITGGDPKILTRDEFVPNRKPNYANIFGEPSKIVKKNKQSPGKRINSPLNVKKSLITHTKVIKNDIITSPRTPSSSNISLPTKESPGSYQCHLCDFTSNRLNVIVLHTKNHKNDPKPTIQTPKSKKSVKSPITTKPTVVTSTLSMSHEKLKPEIEHENFSLVAINVTNNKRKRNNEKTPSATIISNTEEQSESIIISDESVPENKKVEGEECIIIQPAKKSKTENPLTSELLADWSEDESENEMETIKTIIGVNRKQSLDTQNTVSQQKEPIRLDNELVQLIKTVDSNEDIVGVAETSGISNLPDKNQSMPKYRNIPKKDRRDIVLKEFSNGDLITASQGNSVNSNKTSLDEDIEPNHTEMSSDIENSTEKVIEQSSSSSTASTTATNDEIIDIQTPAKTQNENETNKNTENSDGNSGNDGKESQNTSISCFDFKDDEEDEDFLTSLSRLKKKYMSPEKTKEQSDGKSQSDKEEKPEDDQKDDQLTSAIENLLNNTKPSELQIETATVTEKLSPISPADPIVSKEVRALPPKERGKRIFKSRNRSRYDETSSSNNKKIDNSPQIEDKERKATNNEDDLQQVVAITDKDQDDDQENEVETSSDDLKENEINVESVTSKEIVRVDKSDEKMLIVIKECEEDTVENQEEGEKEKIENSSNANDELCTIVIKDSSAENITTEDSKIDTNVNIIEETTEKIDDDVQMEDLTKDDIDLNESESVKEEVKRGSIEIATANEVLDKANELAIAETLISIPNKLTEMVSKGTTESMNTETNEDKTKNESSEVVKETCVETDNTLHTVESAESIVDLTIDFNNQEDKESEANSNCEEIVMEIVCSNNSTNTEIKSVEPDEMIKPIEIKEELSSSENDQNKNSINTIHIDSKDTNSTEIIVEQTANEPEKALSVSTSTRRRRTHMKVTPRKRVVQQPVKLLQLSDPITSIVKNKQIETIIIKSNENPLDNDTKNFEEENLINKDVPNKTDDSVTSTENKDLIDEEEEIESPEYKLIESKSSSKITEDIIVDPEHSKCKILKAHAELIEKQLRRRKDEMKRERDQLKLDTSEEGPLISKENQDDSPHQTEENIQIISTKNDLNESESKISSIEEELIIETKEIPSNNLLPIIAEESPEVTEKNTSNQFEECNIIDEDSIIEEIVIHSPKSPVEVIRKSDENDQLKSEITEMKKHEIDYKQLANDMIKNTSKGKSDQINQNKSEIEIYKINERDDDKIDSKTETTTILYSTNQKLESINTTIEKKKIAQSLLTNPYTKNFIKTKTTSTGSINTEENKFKLKTTVVSGKHQIVNLKIGQNKFEARTPKKRKQTFEEDTPSFVIEKSHQKIGREKISPTPLSSQQPPEKIMKFEKEITITPQQICKQKIIITGKTGEENIFDINNMPILLANESVLTPEHLDKMQIVIAGNSGTSNVSTTETLKSKAINQMQQKSIAQSSPLVTTIPVKPTTKIKKINNNDNLIIRQQQPKSQQQHHPSSSASPSSTPILQEEGKQIGVDGKGNKFVIIKTGNSAKMIIQPDIPKSTTIQSPNQTERTTNVISSQMIVTSSASNRSCSPLVLPRGRLISASGGGQLVITSKGNVIPSNSSSIISKSQHSGITITSTSTMTHSSSQELIMSSPQATISSIPNSSQTKQKIIKQHGHSSKVTISTQHKQSDEQLLNKKLFAQKSQKIANTQTTENANRRIQVTQSQLNEMTRLTFKEEKFNESGKIIITRGLRQIQQQPQPQQQQLLQQQIQQQQSKVQTKIIRKTKIKPEIEQQMIHKTLTGIKEIPPLAPITENQTISQQQQPQQQQHQQPPQLHQHLKQIKKKVPSHSKEKLMSHSSSSSSLTSTLSPSSSPSNLPIITTITTTTSPSNPIPTLSTQIENTDITATTPSATTIEEQNSSPPDLSSKYGDGNLLAVPGETFGGPPNSFFLCTIADNDCGFIPIDNQPLYLDESNQLVPMLPDTDAIIQEKLHSPIGSEISPSEATAIVHDSQLAVEITESGEQVLTDLSQITDGANQTFLINTADGHQILLDQQSLLALVASGGDGAQLVTPDGQQLILPPEILTAIGINQGGEMAGQILLSETLDGQIQTQNQDILAAALAGTEVYHQQDQLIGDVLQIESTNCGNGSVSTGSGSGGVQIVEQGITFQPINQPVTAQTNETNAILTQPPIMSTLEVPSTTNNKKNQHDHGILGSGSGGGTKTNETSILIGSRHNLDDNLAVIGVTTQSSSVPSSLELPITVTNPAIAQPKTTSTPISLSGIFTSGLTQQSTIVSQISPTTLSTISGGGGSNRSINQDQELNYELFTTSTVVLNDNSNNNSCNLSNNSNNNLVSNKTTLNNNVTRIESEIIRGDSVTAGLGEGNNNIEELNTDNIIEYSSNNDDDDIIINESIVDDHIDHEIVDNNDGNCSVVDGGGIVIEDSQHHRNEFTVQTRHQQHPQEEETDSGQTNTYDDDPTR